MNRTLEDFRGSVWQRDDLMFILPERGAGSVASQLVDLHTGAYQELSNVSAAIDMVFRSITKPASATSRRAATFAIVNIVWRIEMVTKPIVLAVKRVANVVVSQMQFTSVALENSVACPRKMVTFRRLKSDKSHRNTPPQKRRLLFGCFEKTQMFQIPEAGVERSGLVGYERKKEHGSTNDEEVCRLHRTQDSQESNNSPMRNWRGFFASLTIWAAFSAPPVQAQELSVSSAQVQRFFASDAMSECLGTAAKDCKSLVPVADTLDIVECNQLETLEWETLLAREYEASKTYLIDTSDPEAPILDALDNAHAAWVMFRDAECNLAYSQYWDGSIRNVIATNCQMRMSAERAVVLRPMRSPSK